MKSLLNWLPQSIAGRLTLWFIFIAVLPSLVLLIAIIWIARGELESAFNEKLVLLDHLRVQELETYANERLREIDLVSRTPIVAQALDDFDRLSQGAENDSTGKSSSAQLYEKYRPIFENLIEPLGSPNMLLVSTEGEILFRLRPGFEVGQSIKQAPLKGTPLADAIEKSIAAAPPSISAPDSYPSTGSSEELIFSSQGVARNQKSLGAVVFQLDSKKIANMFAMNEGMGTTGEAQAVRRKDNEVRMITAPRSDPDGLHWKARYTMGGPSGVAMQNAVNRAEGFGYAVDYRGVPVLAAWGYAPTLDVGVVTKVDRDEALRGINSLRWIGMWLLGLTLLGVIPLALGVAQSFSRPMREAVQMAKLIAGGNLTTQVNTSAAGGEMGLLLRSISEMSDHLRNLIKHIQESIVTVMSTTNQIASVAKQQETTIQEHGSSTVEVAAAVKEISATSQELTRTMGEVQASAVQAGQLAATGQGALNGMHQAMQGLADSTDSISSRLSVISERANNINLAVTTITKVADQTNLLSINAAIEAEKAGDAGRGFLVVAREIRRLADQTAAATLEIERIVKDMQQSVTAGVMEMDKFNKQVRQGVEDAGQIGGKLNEVISAVQQLLPRFEQVTEGMSAQSTGAEQIREAMTDLSNGATHTSESIREFHKATEQLREAISGLRDDISKFQT
jgi:methyl-accepting chemotaxis protein WspA